MDLREEIARVAQDLYVQSGQIPGRDLENWLAAEDLVLSWHEPDEERENHIGKNLRPHDLHVIEPSKELTD